MSLFLMTLTLFLHSFAIPAPLPVSAFVAEEHLLAAYYVSPSGDDQAAGSFEDPWQTIQHAVTNASVQPGDTIYVLPGRYAENIVWTAKDGGVSGAPGRPVTIAAYDPEAPPIISGPEQTTQLMIRDRSHLIIDGLVFADYLGGGLLVMAEDGAVTDIKIRNNRFLRQAVDEKNYWWNVINIYGPTPQNSVSYVEIVGNEFIDTVTGYPGQANENCSLTGNVHHALIEDNLFRRVSNIAIDLLGKAEKGIIGQPAYVIVRNNRFETVYPGLGIGKAVYFDGAAGPVLVEGNYTQDAMGISTNIEAFHNGDNEFRHYLLRNNVVDNRDYDIDVSLKIGSASYGNTEPWPVEPDHVVAVHNVVLNSASTAPLFWGQGSNFRFKNNVVAAYGANAVSGANTRNFADASDWISNGNLYYSAENPTQFVWPGFGVYDSLATLQRTTKQEMNSLTGVPHFVDDDKGDYRLQPFSPGYAQGIPLTFAVNDGQDSTLLAVEDAGYFFDGFDMAPGDVIRLNNRDISIAHVDYDTNTITLAEPADWTTGSSVWYAVSGELPSMGIAETVDCAPFFLCWLRYTYRSLDR